MINLQNHLRQLVYQYFELPFVILYISLIVYGVIGIVFGIVFRKLTQRNLTIMGLCILVLDIFYATFMENIWYISFLVLLAVTLVAYLLYRFIFDKALKWYEIRGINYATTPSERERLIKEYEERNMKD